MDISEKRKEQLLNMPVIETRVFKSKDGEYVIHKVVITDIKPVKYYEAVMAGKEETVV